MYKIGEFSNGENHTSLLIHAVSSPDSANPTAALNPAPPAPTTMALCSSALQFPEHISDWKNTRNGDQSEESPSLGRSPLLLSFSAVDLGRSFFDRTTTYGRMASSIPAQMAAQLFSSSTRVQSDIGEGRNGESRVGNVCETWGPRI